MFLGFGKKRKVTRRRKSVKKTVKVSRKAMYAIKRTKAGRRVVKVVERKKNNKIVKVYASTRRPVAKSVKLYPLKSKAKAALKAMQKKRKVTRKRTRKVTRKRTRKTRRSGFGRKRSGTLNKTLIAGIKKGYVSCIDKDYDPSTNALRKYKEYEYTQIRHNGERYRIVAYKSRNTGDYRVFIVGENAKVRPIGPDSKAVAKRKAKEDSAKYSLLSAVAIDTLQECDSSTAASLGSAVGGAFSKSSSIYKALVPNKMMAEHVAGDIRNALSVYDMYRVGKGMGKVIREGKKNFNQLISDNLPNRNLGSIGVGRFRADADNGGTHPSVYVSYRNPNNKEIRHTFLGNRDYGYNPATGTYEQTNDPQNYNFFGRRRRRSGFGMATPGMRRRVNYGFSQFF